MLTEDLKREIRSGRMSIYRLGKESGIADPSIHRFLRGERDITLRTAERLCEVLGLRLVRTDDETEGDE